jgi:hypothetical protein
MLNCLVLAADPVEKVPFPAAGVAVRESDVPLVNNVLNEESVISIPARRPV